MNCLIDTQIAIWFLVASEKLKSNVSQILTNGNNTIYLSQTSLFEIAIKQSIGKLQELDKSTTYIAELLELDNIEILAIHNRHIENYKDLSFFENHKDPFDRLIIATALTENLTLISSDEKFKLYSDIVELIEA